MGHEVARDAVVWIVEQNLHRVFIWVLFDSGRALPHKRETANDSAVCAGMRSGERLIAGVYQDCVFALVTATAVLRNFYINTASNIGEVAVRHYRNGLSKYSLIVLLVSVCS